MKKVKVGSEADIEYEGRLDDGSLFDTNKVDVAKKEGVFQEGRPYDPLHIKVGEGNLIKGFENALVDMSEGEEKEVKIFPEEGYGMPKADLIKEVGKDFFQGKEVHKGDWIVVTMNGQNIPTRIHEAGPKYSLDFNHPLAGKTLNFKIKVTKIY